MQDRVSAATPTETDGRQLQPIGAHAPIAGGIARAALPYIDATRSRAVQVFIGNPRGWALAEGDHAQDEAFAAGCAERGIPAYVHAPLLINLGSPAVETVHRSAAALAHAVRRGAQIGADAVVFHAGSAVDSSHTEAAWRQVREHLTPILDRAAAAGAPRVLVEPSAGGGRGLAARVEDLARYFASVDDHPWLGVCFDTCHAWAAGHDLRTPGGMTATIDALIEATGVDRLELVHANDSRDPCGSTRDRHDNIGAGQIGVDAFAELLAHPATAGIPMIVETPSRDHSGHAADIAVLTELSERPRKPR